MRKGQTSIELISILAVSIVILAAIFSFSNQSINDLNKEKIIESARTSVNKLKEAVNDVYYQGAGAQKKVSFVVPEGVDAASSGIRNNSFVLSALGNDVYAKPDISISGSLPTKSGSYELWVTAYDSYVAIGQQNISVDKTSIYATVMQGNAGVQDIAITNNGTGTANLIISESWPHTDVDINESIQSFSLNAQQSQIVTIGYSAAQSAAGNYAGTIRIDASMPNGDENISLPINIEVISATIAQEELIVLPSTWPTTIQAGSSEVKSFSICNTTATSMNNIAFSHSNGDAGDWVQNISNIPQLQADSCVNQDINIAVLASASAGNYSGIISLLSNEGKTDTISLSVTVTAAPTQQTTTKWAISLCNWASCDSTSNVTGPANNLYDSTVSNSLGGYDFNVGGLSGSIDNVVLLWSQEIPQVAGQQSSVFETAVADFSDGTFSSTETAAVGNGEVVLSQQPTIDVETAASGSANLTIGRNSTLTSAAQSFVPNVGSITGVSVNVMRRSTPANPLVVRLRSTLNGADIATASIPVASITTSFQWIDATFSSPVSITPGSTYYIVLTTAANVNNKYFLWNTSTSNPYANGNAYQNTTAQSGNDALLRTHYNGYATAGTYTSSAIDFGSVKMINDMNFSATLNGQTLTLAYQLSNNGIDWNAWSIESSSSLVVINDSGRYVRYRATFGSNSSNTAFLESVGINATGFNSGLIDDSIALNYGLSSYNQLNPVNYNNTSTPVDKMDTSALLIERYDATAARPGGGSWQWADFEGLKIGGKYNAVSGAEGQWWLDAVGVEITYTP